MNRSAVYLLALAALLLLGGGFAHSSVDTAPAPIPATWLPTASTRPFLMGITPHPPEYSRKGFERAFGFVRDHADLVVHHFDSGVPWEEALYDRPYSKHLREDWDRRKRMSPAGRPVYLAMTPLNIARDGLALYWGKTDNLPLPAAWRDVPLDDPRVKIAYLRHVQRAIAHFHPTYLAIGVEVNAFIGHHPERWAEYLALHQYVYTQLKAQYPNLIIFATLQYDRLRGVDEEARASVPLERQGIEQLSRFSDVVALSLYKYGSLHNPLSQDFFALAAGLAAQWGKPVVISETGALSRPLNLPDRTLPATETDQAEYIAFLLREATQRRFMFVVQFIGIDYDRLYRQAAPRLSPAMRLMFSVWISTGLEAADGRAKPALTIWEAYRTLPYVPTP